jgi:hypothetical protein
VLPALDLERGSKPVITAALTAQSAPGRQLHCVAVRAVGEQCGQYLGRTAGAGHDLVPCGGEQQDELFPEQGVVLGDHPARGSSTPITVGPGGAGHDDGCHRARDAAAQPGPTRPGAQQPTPHAVDEQPWTGSGGTP